MILAAQHSIHSHALVTLTESETLCIHFGNENSVTLYNSSTLHQSHRNCIPYTRNYWQLEYLAIHSKNAIGEIIN